MITTVIPTYRRPRLLARALRSVLAQTYRDFTVIVYDNASGDETAAVVADFAARDPRVQYVAQPRNLGALANFNVALSRINTAYFSLLSDDDVLLPYFYEQALASFAAHPSAILTASPVMLVDEHGRVLTVNNHDWLPGLHPGPTAMVRMAEREHFIWTGTLFRREALAQGALDVETGMCSDLDLLLRVAGRHPIAVAERPGAVFSVHPGSPSSYPRLSLYWPSWTRIIANAGQDPLVSSAVQAAVQSALERRLNRLLLLVSIFSSSRGLHEEALEAAAALRSRHASPARLGVLALVAFACARIPEARAVLAAVIGWWRWRRGPVAREQQILDQYPGLLALAGEPDRKDAAA
ncbi:MAG: glycosyltransferase [Candidatus Dormibacteraeota bacterium]|nr:glycosyltransferase [Candidatus Dormibacteraeota bacterium]